MYLIIPLGIFFGAIITIFWIISRKFVYLKKLTPEAVENVFESNGNHSSFFAELFPEMTIFFKRVNLRAYGVDILTEFEKLLRKLRLISLKIDGLTNRLIYRVRRSTKKHEQILIKEAELEEEKLSDFEYNDLGSDVDLKEKEQLLIIEIAKNPKDARLYNELGNLYMRTGEYEDAKNSFEKILELEPENEAIHRKLARVLSKLEAAAK